MRMGLPHTRHHASCLHLSPNPCGLSQTRSQTRHRAAGMSAPVAAFVFGALLPSVALRDRPQLSRVGRVTGLRCSVPPVQIRVIGIGGGGSNAVNRMVEAIAPEEQDCVQFVACNTDVQALESSRASQTVQLGELCTRGLGAGGQPGMGREAAMESADALREVVDGQDMVFVTAGMGGGTGSGAAPVVASLAREAGALTVGVVSKPFGFEGRKRTLQAAAAVEELRASVDVLIVVSNDRLLDIVPEGMSLTDSFALADEVLRQGIVGCVCRGSVRGMLSALRRSPIWRCSGFASALYAPAPTTVLLHAHVARRLTDLVTKPGLVNVDFADGVAPASPRLCPARPYGSDGAAALGAYDCRLPRWLHGSQCDPL